MTYMLTYIENEYCPRPASRLTQLQTMHKAAANVTTMNEHAMERQERWQSSERGMERGGDRCEGRLRCMGNMSLLCQTNRMMYRSLDLLNVLPSCMVSLILSNDRMMSEIKNALFSRVDLLKSPLWFLMPLEATLASVVSCPGYVEA